MNNLKQPKRDQTSAIDTTSPSTVPEKALKSLTLASFRALTSAQRHAFFDTLSTQDEINSFVTHHGSDSALLGEIFDFLSAESSYHKLFELQRSIDHVSNN